jgi:4'-phosphopantetheinyl transferase
MIINHWVKQPDKLTIQEGEIQVWVARLDEQKSLDFWEMLSEDEQIRANRIRNPLGSRRYVAARGILRCLLGAYLDLAPGKLVFQYGSHGKPALSGGLEKTISFNLSHSEDLAFYGFAKGLQIGVDIEKIRPLDDLYAMANIVLSSAECNDLSVRIGADKLNQFYNLWTCKEAVLKMTGYGFSFPMKTVTCCGFPSELAPNEVVLPDGRHSEINIITPAKGYTSAIATFPVMSLH